MLINVLIGWAACDMNICPDELGFVSHVTVPTVGAHSLPVKGQT